MFYWSRLLWKLRHGWRRSQLDRELEEEMSLHLSLLEEEAGPDAGRLFGNATLLREESRSSWGWRWAEDFGQDVRFAARGLGRDWPSTAAATGALALGIGFAIAVFTLVNAVLLKPLPYRDPDRLVMLWAVNAAQGWDQEKLPIPEMVDWQKSGLFESVVGFTPNMTTITGPGQPTFTHGYAVTPGFLGLLGAQPMLGRAFSAEEERAGGEKNRVVLRHSFWVKRFGADPTVVGRKILLDDRPYEVVGVMGPEFQFFNRQTDLYVPVPWDPVSIPHRGRNVRVIARLKAGVSLEEAAAKAEALSARFAQEHPESNRGWSVRLTPVSQDTTGPVRPALWVLLASVGLVLLIACVNVTNLLLAQGVVRIREVSLRAALGAGRTRIMRQMLTESLLIALTGGGLGFGIAWLAVDYFQTTLPAQYSAGRFLIQMERIRIDAWVAAFAAGVVPLAAVAFGLIPAWRNSRGDLNAALKESGRTVDSGLGPRRMQNLLVAFEIAMAVVITIGAGLVTRSFQQLYAHGPGFEPRQLKSMFISLPTWQMQFRGPGDWERQVAPLYQRVLTEVAAAPGITGVAAVGHLPLAGFYYLTDFELEGVVSPDPPQAIDRSVSNSYHSVMGVPLREGRDFMESARRGGPRVVLVNETFARRYFGTQSPVGRRLRYPRRQAQDADAWYTIAGVVGGESAGGIEEAPKPIVYFSMEQNAWGLFHLIVKSPQDLTSTVSAVTGVLQRIDPRFSPYEVRTLDDLVLDSTWRVRYSMLLLSAMSAVALILAALGVYGVLSYSVRRRTREIGVRMALGAGRREILGMVTGEGLRVAIAGGVAGLIAALALTRTLATLLFGVSPFDLSVFGAVSLLIGITVLLASLVPARRATALQPVEALRDE